MQNDVYRLWILQARLFGFMCCMEFRVEGVLFLRSVVEQNFVNSAGLMVEVQFGANGWCFET